MLITPRCIAPIPVAVFDYRSPGSGGGSAAALVDFIGAASQRLTCSLGISRAALLRFSLTFSSLEVRKKSGLSHVLQSRFHLRVVARRVLSFRAAAGPATR